MINLGNRISGSPIMIDMNGSISLLKRVRFDTKDYDEGWIQEIIRNHPEILPVDELEPVFAPLVCIGREVSTEAGSIDNLYISPQGYLTIVETKLWRNPEARREVVGQIIDYAKDINRWSFKELDEKARFYNNQYHNEELGIIDTLRRIEQIEESDEPEIIDIITRNMKQGRFLLLIVGDGIRESVEEMVSFLSKTPQLLFTLALIELQVYQTDESHTKKMLLIPQVVTRTREITRAVVRIEGKEIESIQVGVDTSIETEKSPTLRKTLTEQDYFNALSRRVNEEDVKFAREVLNDMHEIGCVIDWKSASFVVKLRDPGGSGKLLTLFVVQTNGEVFLGWLFNQLESLNLPGQIAYEYVRDTAVLFDNCEVRDNDKNGLTRTVSLRELKQQYTKFRDLVRIVIDKIGQATREQYL